jgi:hypothetical protein
LDLTEPELEVNLGVKAERHELGGTPLLMISNLLGPLLMHSLEGVCEKRTGNRIAL